MSLFSESFTGGRGLTKKANGKMSSETEVLSIELAPSYVGDY